MAVRAGTTPITGIAVVTAVSSCDRRITDHRDIDRRDTDRDTYLPGRGHHALRHDRLCDADNSHRNQPHDWCMNRLTNGAVNITSRPTTTATWARNENISAYTGKLVTASTVVPTSTSTLAARAINPAT